MKRTGFIKNMIGLFGITALPAALATQYSKIYLLQCFIRGFRFYEGPGLLDTMRQGDMLELVREPENEHDNFAIALHYNNRKIGYLPAEQNEILSKLIDAGVIDLLAEITQLEASAAAWENVCIAVYVLKKDTYNSKYPTSLTSLETTQYFTLKHEGNKLTRFSSRSGDILDGEDFYKALVKNSKNDKIYGLIHNQTGSPEELEAIVDEGLLVIDRSKLPADLNADSVLLAFEKDMVTLDNTFTNEGYVVAQIDRVAELSARIEHFIPVKDKTGFVFWEVVLGK